MRRLLLSSLASLSLSARAATPIELTEDEFKMHQHYELASADPRVQAMKADARLPAIAKDAGWKAKDLQKALERFAAAGDLKAACEANLKEALAGGELAGKLTKSEVDVSGAAAVIRLEWLNDEPKALLVEASWGAAKASAACAFVSTITVAASDKASRQKTFSALISTASGRRISADKVRDFAEGRYARLFEKVKNAANGDDLSESAPAATK
jgi:hypothetical protein